MENYKKQNLIKYHNNLNTVAFRKFKASQIDIIFSICQVFQTHSDKKEIEISSAFIRELANYRNATVKSILNDVEMTLRSFNECEINSYETNERIICYLFKVIKINYDTNVIKIKLNEEFRWIIDELNKNFTMFKIDEMIRLNSKYSKILFPILMQWKSVGKYVVGIEEFRNQLGIPTSYKISEIDKRVLKPIKKDLESTSILNFNISKEYKKNKVDKIIFSFSPSTQKLKGNIVPEWLGKKVEVPNNQISLEDDVFNIFDEFEKEENE